MSDWLKLHRSIEENEFWFGERFTKAQAWIDLLLLATYKPRTVFIRGVEINLKPGELCYSQVSLAKRWKWNFKTVVSFLSMLSKREMVETKTSNVTTVISIRNWKKYQSNGEQSGDQSGEQMETRTETNKECKEGKEGKEIDSPNGSSAPNQQKSSQEKSVSPVREFQSWWAAEYQRRFGEKYMFNFGKDGKLIKGMLAAVGDDIQRLKAKAVSFFDSGDEFIERAGYTIGVFQSRFNSIRLPPTNGEGKFSTSGITATQRYYQEKKT
jgi:hypothetical protein